MSYHDLFTNDREARMLLSILTEPGDHFVGEMVQRYGLYNTLARIFETDVAYPAMFGSDQELTVCRSRLTPRLPRTPMRELEAQWHDRHKIRVLIPGDAKWPSGLDDLGSGAPWCLYVRGDAQALAEVRERHSVAIVGARAATSYGEHVTTEMVNDLAGTGIPIVSGGAYGIDGAAHRAALAVGGITVAFMAGGVDRYYPAGHNELLSRVAAAGAVVSEVPPGSAPTKWRFLARNRLIAASTNATVVVEAGFRSGSLNTAGHALALGRPLGAVPGPITSAASAGTHRIIREMGGALITGADDVKQLLGYDPAVGPRPRLAVIDEEV